MKSQFVPILMTLLLSPVTPILGADSKHPSWDQWRGPTRDGQFVGPRWPDNLSEASLVKQWRVDLPQSYSGPIVSASSVFVTGTEGKNETVITLDRETGKQRWRADWPGAMTVPFFAASNGSWIRSTPALDGKSLFVAGMRDVLVSLNAETGAEQWRMDFVKEFGSPLPSFGFVCSPLADGNAIYVQAAASFVKLDKMSGKVIWRTLKDDGGMMGSAFSSPIIATLAGIRQIVVQTREMLAGINPENGEILWEQKIPSFRGMNILTPVVFDGHAYFHLQNQRFACINLLTGERTWTSTPHGKYSSLVAQGDRILALDQTGRLLLLRANPSSAITRHADSSAISSPIA